MKDQPSVTNDEDDAYYAEGTPSEFDVEECLRRLDEVIAEIDFSQGPHLISADELRAAGALKSAAERRRPVASVRKPKRGTSAQRELFPGLADEPREDDSHTSGSET